MLKKKEKEANRAAERRSEPRILADPFHSVQFAIEKKVPIYQFKLRDFSPSGLCILVRDDSAVLKGSRKNNLAELALRFGLDLADPKEQNHRNSELFRGFCE
jgi:hypothetical protein